MTRQHLLIERVVLRADAERRELEAAVPVLRRAFQLLAERLATTPGTAFRSGTRIELDRLEIHDLERTELFTERGSEHIATMIYHQLMEHGRG